MGSQRSFAMAGEPDFEKLMAEMRGDLASDYVQNAVVFERPETPKVSAQSRRDIQSAMDNDISRLSSSSMNTTANIPVREPQVNVLEAAYDGLAGLAKLKTLSAERLNRDLSGRGKTPLYNCIEDFQEGSAGAVRNLVSAKADLNIPDKEGKTPLWLTAYNGSFWSCEYDTLMRNAKYSMADSMDDVLIFLVDAKADVNKATKYGQIPLHWAAYHGNDSTVKKLILAKADVNKRTDNNWTPLYRSALTNSTHQGKVSTTRILIEAGADVDVALSYAKRTATKTVIAEAMETATR